jgi:WD40 repeat protein
MSKTIRAAGLALALVLVSSCLMVQAQQDKEVPPTASSPDQRLVATASDKSVSIFDAATQKELVRFLGHTGKVTALAFSPDGKLLASGSQDKTVSLWDVSTGRQLRRFQRQAEVTAVRFSQDGWTLTARGGDKSDRTWDIATGKLILTEKK